MNNHRMPRARVTALLLTLALCLALVPAAGAADSAQTIYLDSAADFAAFAKNCSLDTWSQGKTFILRADISLSGVDFTPAASFGGTFEGRGHTISDFNLTQNASPAGLFGTILPGGRVANLNVAGSVAAGGDKIACGGIAGENYGRIVCCRATRRSAALRAAIRPPGRLSAARLRARGRVRTPRAALRARMRAPSGIARTAAASISIM